MDDVMIINEEVDVLVIESDSDDDNEKDKQTTDTQNVIVLDPNDDERIDVDEIEDKESSDSVQETEMEQNVVDKETVKNTEEETFIVKISDEPGAQQVIENIIVEGEPIEDIEALVEPHTINQKADKNCVSDDHGYAATTQEIVADTDVVVNMSEEPIVKENLVEEITRIEDLIEEDPLDNDLDEDVLSAELLAEIKKDWLDEDPQIQLVGDTEQMEVDQTPALTEMPEKTNKMQRTFQKQLIRQVRKHRLLYDKRHRHFSRQELKEEAWKQVALALHAEPEKCQNCWLDLRFEYQRYVRKMRTFLQTRNKTRKKRPLMQYEREMLFLWQHISERSCGPLPDVMAESAAAQSENAGNDTTVSAQEEDDDVVLLESAPIEVIDVDADDAESGNTHQKAKTRGPTTIYANLRIGPDIQRLVEIIKMYPELYNADNRYFNDYKRKGIIWSSIANELNDKATKLMKCWMLLVLRYEWEMYNYSYFSFLLGPLSELQTLLSFLQPYINNNPKSILRQSKYLYKEWYEPIEHFKNIYNLLATMKKYPDVINLTEDSMTTNVSLKDYKACWHEVALLKDCLKNPEKSVATVRENSDNQSAIPKKGRPPGSAPPKTDAERMREYRQRLKLLKKGGDTNNLNGGPIEQNTSGSVEQNSLPDTYNHDVMPVGQCEVTWLLLRSFYWELMYMRKDGYQLQDKWYFESIISDLYKTASAVRKKHGAPPIGSGPTITLEPKVKQGKNSKKVTVEKRAQVAKKRSIWSKTSEDSPKSTATTSTMTTPPINAIQYPKVIPSQQPLMQQFIMPKITAACSLAPMTLQQPNDNTNLATDNTPAMPTLIQATNTTSLEQSPAPAAIAPITLNAATLVTLPLKPPPLVPRPIEKQQTEMPAVSLIQTVGTPMVITNVAPLNNPVANETVNAPATTTITQLYPTTYIVKKSKLPQKLVPIAPKPATITVTNTASSSPRTGFITTVPLARLQQQPVLPTLPTTQIQPTTLLPTLPQHSKQKPLIIQPVNATEKSRVLQIKPTTTVTSSTSATSSLPSLIMSSSSQVSYRKIQSAAGANGTTVANDTTTVTSSNTITPVSTATLMRKPTTGTTGTLPTQTLTTQPKLPMLPKLPPLPKLPTLPTATAPAPPERSLTMMSTAPTLPSAPTLNTATSSPAAPTTSSSSSSSTPPAHALNPNEVIIELIAMSKGNFLVVQGPMLKEKFMLSMGKTACFIREIISIPLLHNKNYTDMSNYYWNAIAQKFSLPANICRACWNFLSENFQHFPQIAPMNELMRPVKIQNMKVWKTSNELFKGFNERAIQNGWLQYTTQLPLLIGLISRFPSLYKDIMRPGGKVPNRPMNLFESNAYEHIAAQFKSIPNIPAIWTAFKEVFLEYMIGIENGIENNWPYNWWHALAKCTFLYEARYHDRQAYYYIVRYKIIEELERCTNFEAKMSKIGKEQNRGKLKMLHEIRTYAPKKARPKVRPVPAAGDENTQMKLKFRGDLDAYELILSIRRHPQIYEKCDVQQKRLAWASVAKELRTNITTCRLTFQYALKTYRKFKRADVDGGCPITQKYFRYFEEIERVVRLQQSKITIKTPTQLNQSVMNSGEPSDIAFPEYYIPEITMTRNSPALVMKNWAYAVGTLKRANIEQNLISIFAKYRHLANGSSQGS